MSATAMRVYANQVPFNNTPEYYRGLAEYAGIILDSDELESLREIFDENNPNCEEDNLSWCDFYNDGFMPAYRENLREELIRRGREGADGSIDIYNPDNNCADDKTLDELFVKGGELVAREMFGDYIDDYCSQNAFKYNLNETSAHVGAAVALVGGIVEGTSLEDPFSMTCLRTNFTPVSFGGAAILGGLVAGITGYIAYKIKKAGSANEALGKKIQSFITSIQNGEPLRFDGYNID